MTTAQSSLHYKINALFEIGQTIKIYKSGYHFKRTYKMKFSKQTSASVKSFK